MWKDLPQVQRDEYKRMILAFASLTELFAQKSDSDNKIPAPIINSKYQETLFQKVFKASAEDIGNTSYDAALLLKKFDGTETKYLIGIKTFGINAGAQKIAQFKANNSDWSADIECIKNNATGINDKTVINSKNDALYLKIAKAIALLRNKRIESAKANIQGFDITDETDDVQSVYHVLMPSKKGEPPLIFVGETSYDKINIENISIEGCTSASNPDNFVFNDGNHRYRYTSADSQLLMDFKNNDIIQEDGWEVIYADNAYDIFKEIADKIYGKTVTSENNDFDFSTPVHHENVESYSWLITNSDNEVELFSGFNAFYGVGSKLGKDARKIVINKIREEYINVIPQEKLTKITTLLSDYLLSSASTNKEKLLKVQIRKDIIEIASEINNNTLMETLRKVLYRPHNEVYIPIPNSATFHRLHPNFFNEQLCTFNGNSYVANKDVSGRTFNLIFEPSGNQIQSFITQDNGKAIESLNSQAHLGEWILRGVFQLNEYEPLTAKKLKEVGINGLRLWKKSGEPDVHLQFIWIDSNELPDDYIK